MNNNKIVHIVNTDCAEIWTMSLKTGAIVSPCLTFYYIFLGIEILIRNLTRWQNILCQ